MFAKTRLRASGAIAIAGTVAMVATALAAPANAAKGPNIDPDAKGSITVHKYADADDTHEHDGTKLGASDLADAGDILEGVEFTVYEVASPSVDLTTNAGWQQVENLEASSVTAGAVVGQNTTGSNGEVVFDDLGLGLYLVKETDTGDNNVSARAPDFLVTIPFPSSDDTWNYDVHVYPKNSTSEVTKAVDDSEAFALGDEVDWTISAEIPDGAEKVVFTDTLDSRLEFVSASIGGTTLDSEVSVSGQEVTVTLDGNLGNYIKDGEIAVVITTKVTGVGDIENEALVNIDDNDISSNPVDTEWGDLVIKKVGEDSGKTLAGAEFEVYESKSQFDNGASPLDTATSGQNGIVHFDGFKSGDYYLVESKAPTGYDGDYAGSVTVKTGETSKVDLTVTNTQKTSVSLPMTGGDGKALFILSGIGLLAIAVGIGVRQRMKNKALRA